LTLAFNKPDFRFRRTHRRKEQANLKFDNQAETKQSKITQKGDTRIQASAVQQSNKQAADSVDSSVSSECFGSGTCRIAQAHQGNKACESVEIDALSTLTDRNQQRGTTVNRSRTIPPVGFFNECCNNIGATGDDPAVCQAPLVGDRRRTVRAGSRTCHQKEAESSELSGSAAGSGSGEREPNTVARRVRDAQFPRPRKNSLSPVRRTFPLPRSGTWQRAAICSAASRSFFWRNRDGQDHESPPLGVEHDVPERGATQGDA
jgi:hypothetical protein